MSGLWSEAGIASSGIGSERAQVASVFYEEAEFVDDEASGTIN